MRKIDMTTIDDTMPTSVGLMVTLVKPGYAVTTGAWYPFGRQGPVSYESMIHRPESRKLVYHKGLKGAFHAHLGIVKQLRRFTNDDMDNRALGSSGRSNPDQEKLSDPTTL